MPPRALRNFFSSVRITGFWPTVIYKWDRIRTALGMPVSGLMRIQPKGLPHPLWLRPGKSSDMNVYRDIFIHTEYAPIAIPDSSALMLDLGANIGASAIWFLSRYPSLRVIAIEPDPVNFQRCQRNLAPYGNRAILVQGAVWSHPCDLAIQSYPSGEGREWGVTVSEATEPGPSTIRAWDLPSLAALAGSGCPIDLLKVDIEGSERQLFSPSARTWLPLVRNICIELHGPDCDEIFWNAMKHWRCTVAHSGELTICTGLTAA
jgi:FkbM family methyltransferase